MAAIDLEQHPLAGHPLTPDAVRRAAGGGGDSGCWPARRIRRTVQLLTAQALVLPQQLGEVGVVRSRVAGGGQAHHGRGDIGRDGVVRTAPAVAVGERRGSHAHGRRG